MRAGAVAVPIAPIIVPLPHHRPPPAATPLSGWDLLPDTESAPTLSVWDLLPAVTARSRPPLWQRLQQGLVALGMGIAALATAHAQAGEVPYEARRGETLRQIAERLWGRPEAWRSLWRLNRDRVRQPGFLSGTTILRLPDRPGAPGPLPPNPLAVRRGDTLWDLAGQIYGDCWAWPLIWGANRGAIRDPHWIYPQQRLRWPSRGRLHVVRPGETLWSIAAGTWGDGRLWPRLWRANRGWLVRPQSLPVSSRLWVPDAR
jgi:nucleoid-associated protein YgaU